MRTDDLSDFNMSTAHPDYLTGSITHSFSKQFNSDSIRSRRP